MMAGTAAIVGAGLGFVWGLTGLASAPTDELQECAESIQLDVPVGPKLIDIAIGDRTCAVTEDHRVVCWGASSRELSPFRSSIDLDGADAAVVIPGLKALRIEADRDSTCVIAMDRSVWCFNGGQPPFDTGVRGAHDLVLGDGYACGLSLAGRVHCGRSWFYDKERDPPLVRTVRGIPRLRNVYGANQSNEDLCGETILGRDVCWEGFWLARNIIWPAIATFILDSPLGAKRDHLPHRVPDADGGGQCRIVAHGKVECWPQHQRLPSDIPQEVQGIRGAVSIASLDGTHCALLDTGYAKCWGRHRLGHLGYPRLISSGTPVAACGLRDIVDIASTDLVTYAVRDDGTVYCWGGGCLLNDPARESIATEVAGITDAVQVDVTFLQACVLQRSGDVQCWGRSGLEPSFGITDAIQISVGVFGACALRESGTVVCRRAQDLPGYVKLHYERVGDVVGDHGLIGVKGIEGATQLTVHPFRQSGDYSGCAVLSDNSLSCWEHHESKPIIHSPEWPATKVVHAYLAGRCIETSNATVLCGADRRLWVPTPEPSRPLPISIRHGTLAISHGRRVQKQLGEYCAIDSSGQVQCWNAGAPWGEVYSVVLEAPIKLTQGREHTCALTEAGLVYCWGDNRSGQLGTNSGPPTKTPHYVTVLRAQ